MVRRKIVQDTDGDGVWQGRGLLKYLEGGREDRDDVTACVRDDVNRTSLLEWNWVYEPASGDDLYLRYAVVCIIPVRMGTCAEG